MKIDNLTLSFKNKIVLRDINLEIKPWEFVFFIGYSWSGKTTLIRSLIWDFKPERWDIVLDNWGFLYRNLTEKLLLDYRKSIGVIFQDYKLMESKTVYENVAFAMEVCWYKDKQIEKKDGEYYFTNTGEKVDIHKHFVDEIFVKNEKNFVAKNVLAIHGCTSSIEKPSWITRKEVFEKNKTGRAIDNQTGPALRGDSFTMEKHLGLLKDLK